MLQELHISIKTIKDVAVFNVVEIDLDTLNEKFFYWSRSNERWAIYDDYNSVFPHAHIKFIKPNLYKIIFEFYGYNEIIEKITYKLSQSSVNYIINNLTNKTDYIHKL